jgi:YHS domain-containing protein
MTSKDPVWGMIVDENNAKYTSDLNGNRIYFCRAQCKQQFDKMLLNMDIKFRIHIK